MTGRHSQTPLAYDIVIIVFLSTWRTCTLPFSKSCSVPVPILQLKNSQQRDLVFLLNVPRAMPCPCGCPRRYDFYIRLKVRCRHFVGGLAPATTSTAIPPKSADGSHRSHRAPLAAKSDVCEAVRQTPLDGFPT